MTIPTFKSQEHEDEYTLLFAQKANTYISLMNHVRDMMYGTGNCDYRNLPGTCLEVVRDITQSLLYDVEFEFEQDHPEYKREDDVFIPRRTFKEDVTWALLEANQKFWNSSNDGYPIDTSLDDVFPDEDIDSASKVG